MKALKTRGVLNEGGINHGSTLNPPRKMEESVLEAILSTELRRVVCCSSTLPKLKGLGFRDIDPF